MMEQEKLFVDEILQLDIKITLNRHFDNSLRHTRNPVLKYAFLQHNKQLNLFRKIFKNILFAIFNQ